MKYVDVFIDLQRADVGSPEETHEKENSDCR